MTIAAVVGLSVEESGGEEGRLLSIQSQTRIQVSRAIRAAGQTLFLPGEVKRHLAIDRLETAAPAATRTCARLPELGSLSLGIQLGSITDGIAA